MDEVIDVFGLACMAHLNGEPSNHVTERDDGHTREVDASYYFRSFEEWPEYEQQAVQESKGRVLDVGLGAGRHASGSRRGGTRSWVSTSLNWRLRCPGSGVSGTAGSWTSGR